MIASVAREREGNPQVGIWELDEGFQIVRLLLRSDGRYQLQTKSTDPSLDFASTESGRYGLDDRDQYRAR